MRRGQNFACYDTANSQAFRYTQKASFFFKPKSAIQKKNFFFFLGLFFVLATAFFERVAAVHLSPSAHSLRSPFLFPFSAPGGDR